MTSRDPNVKVVTQIPLKFNVSKTVQNGWIATKLAHDGPHMGLHPRYAQGQRQGQRSRDMDTFVISRKRTSINVKMGMSLRALLLLLLLFPSPPLSKRRY